MARLCAEFEPAVVDVVAHRIVHAADQAAVEGQAGDGGQVALAGAEGHVRARGVAPLRHEVAVAQHQPVRTTTGPGGADDLGEGPLVGVRLANHRLQVGRPGGLVGHGEGDRLLERGPGHPHLLGAARLPVVAGTGDVGRLRTHSRPSDGGDPGEPRRWVGASRLVGARNAPRPLRDHRHCSTRGASKHPVPASTAGRRGPG